MDSTYGIVLSIVITEYNNLVWTFILQWISTRLLSDTLISFDTGFDLSFHSIIISCAMIKWLHRFNKFYSNLY